VDPVDVVDHLVDDALLDGAVLLFKTVFADLESFSV
jgi:hypothetical protein